MLQSNERFADATTAGEPPAQGEPLARELGIPFVASLAQFEACPEFVSKIPIAFARTHQLIGLKTNGNGGLDVAIASLASWEQLDAVSRLLRRNVTPLIATTETILGAINQAYQQRSGQAQEAIEQLDRQEILAELEAAAQREDLLDVSSRAPVIKLVNLLLLEAVKSFASDVHVQPYEQKLVVRMRIDGILYDCFDVPKNIQEEVISRVKVMGRMNIAEKRVPQDGRATVQVGDHVIDLRIASLPTSYGERVVIRLLDKGARLYGLGELGMDDQTLQRFRKLISAEHGLLLVTGPTGSGKTTTLYAALKELDCVRHNILTLEDPIEYQLEGISQTQVSAKKGMTFASGLRSVLRQDPDVIMVGEIRDHETATMAIQSALTGHLVFSTLHTNDAASAVTRLLDLGIEPYLVASSLIGVLAQRLVRRICDACGASSTLGAQEVEGRATSKYSPAVIASRGRGCPKCRQTGFRGRFGVFELLRVDDPIRQQIQRRAAATSVKAAALAGGMRALRDDGYAKVLVGITTLDEVERVTTDDCATGSADAPTVADAAMAQ